MSNLTILDVFRFGLEYANKTFKKASYNKATKQNHRHFCAAYGICPEAVLSIFDDLHTVDIGSRDRDNSLTKAEESYANVFYAKLSQNLSKKGDRIIADIDDDDDMSDLIAGMAWPTSLLYSMLTFNQ